MSTPHRYCALGNHFTTLDAFKHVNGKPAKSCRACVAKRKEPMNGVDIDAIHFKLGAVRRKH